MSNFIDPDGWEGKPLQSIYLLNSLMENEFWLEKSKELIPLLLQHLEHQNPETCDIIIRQLYNWITDGTVPVYTLS